ncbi:hypothetical protein VD0002_g6421 [Verticillium dahliae]|nr:hypothetical protein VD0003_g7615 [Verticillium dahliae]PNH61370.1 hypothetical protein VD0002_g6421 [Verticillium dahliae]PNH73363.1 hypothetical protein VD0001_g4173 [Verticillium dahliae]
MSLLNLLTAGYCVKRASLGPIAGASLHVRVRDWPEMQVLRAWRGTE